MYFRFIAGLLLLFLSTEGATAQSAIEKGILTTISGQITQANSPTIDIRFFRDFVSLEEEEYQIFVDSLGHFEMEFQLKAAIPLILVCNSQELQLYIEPGESLQLHFDALQVLPSVSFNGSGSIHNRYLKEAQLRFGHWDEEFILYELVTKKPLVYNRTINSLYYQKRDFYKTFQQSHAQEFSEAFQQFAIAENDYWWAYQLLRYRIEHGVANNRPIPLDLPFEYYDFLNKILISNDWALNNRYYHYFLDQYLAFRSEKPMVLGDKRFKLESRTVSASSMLMLAGPDQPPVIGELDKGTRVKDLKSRSSFSSKIMMQDSIRESHWLKVQTWDGKIGWVIELGTEKEETAPIGKGQFNDRPAAQYLRGRSLFHRLASELFWQSRVDTSAEFDQQLTYFNTINPYPEYTSLLLKDSLQADQEILASTTTRPRLSRDQNPVILSLLIAEEKGEEEAKVKPNTAQTTVAEEVQAVPVFANEYVEINNEAAKRKRFQSQIDIKVNGIGTGVEMVLYSEPVLFQEVNHPISPNANGLFRLELELADVHFGHFRYKNQQIPFILEPGKNYSISYTNGDIANSLHFSGETGAANNYLKAQYLHFKSMDKRLKKEFKRSSHSAFKGFMDQCLKEKYQYLLDYNEKHTLSASFITFARAEIEYWYAAQLFNYPWEHPLLNDKEAPLAVPSGYYNFTNEIAVDAEGALPSMQYTYFLSQFFNHKKEQHPDLSEEELARKYLSGDVLNYALCKWYVLNCKRGKARKMGPAIQSFLEQCPNEQYNDLLRQVYNESKGLVKGMKAPAFELKDINGESLALADLAGKIIYIDFWATWCSPCLHYMRNSQEWKKRFSDQDVAFVYISLDKEEASWRSFVKGQQFSGIHLLSLSGNVYQSKIARLYKVNRLPAIFVLDRTGRLVYNSYEDSAQGRLEDIIEGLLRGD